MLPFDDAQRLELKSIFDRTYNDIKQASKEQKVTDKDAVINAILEFMEKMIPPILKSYKGEEYEAKLKGFAASLRIVIWAIMPFDKFEGYMQLDEIKGLDGLIKELHEKGFVEGPESFEALFKSTEAPKGMYG